MNNQLFDLTKLVPENKYTANAWTKIKVYCLIMVKQKELARRGIKDKDKMMYKQKIGFNIIDDNKYNRFKLKDRLLIKELLAWIDIYNDYRLKMPLFYEHSKEYIPLFNKILNIVGRINQVSLHIDIM